MSSLHEAKGMIVFMKTKEKIIITLLLIYPIILLISLDRIATIQTYNIIREEDNKRNEIKEEFKVTNIDNCKIDGMVFNDKVRLIRCVDNQFYIMNKETNDIIGPMNQDESMNAFKKYLDIEILNWED